MIIVHPDPIDCDVDCGGSASVGGAVTFISGKTYYLRIDGCSGAVCPVQISVNPSTAIESQSDTLNSNLSDISGLNTITCLGDKTYTYCTIPINDCSKDYNWIIESGNAIIDNSGGQIIDNDPSNPGKNISKTGIGRNCVNLKFKGAGPVKLSVIGSNGINFTNKVTKTIEVLQTTIDSININICPNQYFYENDTLLGDHLRMLI
ncbi:MAG: hypothetical protein IPL95_12835 [Saprospiraceae bacterium]|nr:hypothetical protein [Saprospiraceae bacterium]